MGTAQWSLLFLLASSLELCHSSFLDYGLGAGDTEFNGGNENLHLVSASSTIKIWKTAELKFYVSLIEFVFYHRLHLLELQLRIIMK